MFGGNAYYKNCGCLYGMCDCGSKPKRKTITDYKKENEDLKNKIALLEKEKKSEYQDIKNSLNSEYNQYKKDFEQIIFNGDDAIKYLDNMSTKFKNKNEFYTCIRKLMKCFEEMESKELDKVYRYLFENLDITNE